MQLIPAIDLRSGRCVRLRQGDFAALKDYGDNPAELARRYRRWGTRWLHVVDLDGAKAGAPVQLECIAELARTPGVAVQAGGGVRRTEDLQRLFAAGVARVVVGSLALSASEQVVDWLTEHGTARVALALDVRWHDGAPQIYTAAWTEHSGQSLWAVLDWFLQRTPIEHVLCTDIGRDGMLVGPNLPLYTTARTRFPEIRWQASGGIRRASDLAALAEIGISAAISGTALLEGKLEPTEMRPYLPNA